MIVVTAATQMELDPFIREYTGRPDVMTCLTGIGPVAAATRIALFLVSAEPRPSMVVNIGVAGAFVHSRVHPGVLDICLAEQEILGDLGICYQDRIERFSSPDLEIQDHFVLDGELLSRARTILDSHGESVHTGSFVTVNCVSATRDRGDFLGSRHNALCENMEGGAVACVCAAVGLPMLEMRCVSNLVEDRDRSKWKLQQACSRSGKIAAAVVEGLIHAS